MRVTRVVVQLDARNAFELGTMETKTHAAASGEQVYGPKISSVCRVEELSFWQHPPCFPATLPPLAS
jgi:hypothetical protein